MALPAHPRPYTHAHRPMVMPVTQKSPSLPPGSAWVHRVRRTLLAWYRRHRRALPWRNARDPYAIWVSEIMLQQTQVRTAEPYFRRFLQHLPTVHALAEASEDDLLRLWEGLGYYSRVRAMRRAAQVLVEQRGGRLPADAASLRKLPGIGPYTAGAISSIAFGRPEPAVDGNVTRVLCRLRSLSGDPSRAPLREELWGLAGRLVPSQRPGDFNQALMELGATVCRPTRPACNRCPLERECLGAAQGLAAALPVKQQRPSTRRIREAAALIRRRGRWLLVQPGAEEPRWAGLWQFPFAQVDETDDPSRVLQSAVTAQVGLHAAVGDCAVSLSYAVTRYLVRLEAFRCAVGPGRARPGRSGAVRWANGDELSLLAMPAPHRKIAYRLAQGTSR